jgi:hypothetical protein
MALMLAACNLPGSPANPGPSVNDQAATIVAATLQAAVPSALAAMTPFASPVAPAVTPTSKPTLFINTNNASCRSGPGGDFKVIATFAAGTTVDMLGKDSADSYWIVSDPGSHDLCWLQAQDGTPSGSFEALPEITPQVTTKGVPAAPTIFYPNFSCDASTLTTSLTWNDVADNENGYRLYRNGNQIADLSANSTKFVETIDFTFGSQETYAVAAYNDAGSSPRKTLTFKCPP